jgi:hypothetical protein
MKTNGLILPVDRTGNVMKSILLLGCGGALFFCISSTTHHWLLRLFLGAIALLALLHEAGRRAPVGYEDERGFHYLRAVRKPRRKFSLGSLLYPARSPLKA